MTLYLDLETRSQTDLTFHGLRRYAECPTTRIINMAYAFDDEEVKLWWAGERHFPMSVLEYISKGGPIWAHSAQFEQHLFEYVIANDWTAWGTQQGDMPPKPTQWRCSMALALASGYMGGLDAAATALGLQNQKHPQGARLIREYCAPGFLTEFKPGDRELMGQYVIDDVKCMREMIKCLRPLTDDEWAEYHLNARINDRGLPVDIDLCTAALGYTQEVAADAAKEITALTGGKMTKHTQRKSRDAWILPKLTDAQKGLLTVCKKGVKKTSFDQDHREYLLACDDLDHDARKLIELINDAGSSALMKYAVAVHQHIEGRVHNTFLWHGAARTGRFAGRGLQPHNMRRDCYEPNEAKDFIRDILGGYELRTPSKTMAKLLRTMIKSDKGIYWVDWKSIEGRVAPWLANSRVADKKLKLYEHGLDVYKVTAGMMFGMKASEIDSNLRQSGKIAELSLQYGGSHNALIGMSKNYGITLEEDVARDHVQRWRRINPWAQTTWSDYERTIEAAVRSPGTTFSVRRVRFHSDGKNFLWCWLPSGHLLSYPKPRWEPYTTPWGEERVGPTFQIAMKPPAGEPPLRNHLRGALVFQNTVQGVAAIILREALIEADIEGLNIIGHCHDEIIGEGSKSDGEGLNAIMLDIPEWAEGLPLATSGVKTGERYGK